MGDDVVVYEFSRSKVERGDFRNFMDQFALDKLPKGRRLREMMNSFIFCIQGWDDDPREIHMIPEVRSFYSAFHRAWPYWLYFCDLETDTLRAMTICCLPEMTTLQVDGRPKVAVTFERLELLKFLKANFLPMNLICERAEMFEERIYDRSKALFEYFGLPFGGEQ